MSDLISRQAAIDAVEKESQVDGAYGYMDTKSIVDLLNDLPSADTDLSNYSDKLWKIAYERGKAEAQNKGEWSIEDCHAATYKYCCSECKAHHRAMYDYCPSCGADMRGEKDG